MLSHVIDANLFALACLGVGGTVLSLVHLLTASARRRLLSLLASAAAVVGGLGFGGLAYALDEPAGFWAPPLALAGAAGAMLLLQTPAMPWLLSRLQQPGWQGLILLAGSFGGVAAWTQLVVTSDEAFLPEERRLDTFSIDPLEMVPGSTAHTDKGRAVTLKMNVSGASLAAEAAEERQFQALKEWNLLEKVIRLEGAFPLANCHGWVFTDGHYWLPSEEVDPILQENGYTAVSAPQPGDVTVYRDESQNVIHTGIVWAVQQGGMTLVESKWGRLGIFLHPLEVHPYGEATFTFYRSARPGHRIQGLPSESLSHPGRLQSPVAVAGKKAVLF